MCSGDLSQYDIKPKYMLNYIRYHGYHFNKQLCEFACSNMYKWELTRKVKVQPYTKEEVDTILERYNVKLNNKKGYDHVFVANMCKADFLGDSVPNEQHLAKYVKNVIDDVDGYEGIVFYRWYADCCKKGIIIDWEEMI